MGSKDHRDNDKHIFHEVSAVNKKIKEKNPEPLITVKDLDSIYDADDMLKGETNEGTQYEVRWVYEEIEDSFLAYWTIQQWKEVEDNLSEVSFINGYHNTNKSRKNQVNNAGSNDIYEVNMVAGKWKDELIGGKINSVPHIDNDNKCTNGIDLPKTMAEYPRTQGVEKRVFDGLSLDKCGNRGSVISVRQY